MAAVKNIEMYHLVLNFACIVDSFCVVNCLVHSTCMQRVINIYKGCMEVNV